MWEKGRRGCPCRVPPNCVASARTNQTPGCALCSYHAHLILAVSMATVALDCYSSNCNHGNSLQPWSLGAGIFRQQTWRVKRTDIQQDVFVLELESMFQKVMKICANKTKKQCLEMLNTSFYLEQNMSRNKEEIICNLMKKKSCCWQLHIFIGDRNKILQNTYHFIICNGKVWTVTNNTYVRCFILSLQTFEWFIYCILAQ